MHRRKRWLRRCRSCAGLLREMMPPLEPRSRVSPQGLRRDLAKRLRRPSPGFELYIGREFPNEIASPGHAVRNALRGKWSGQNRRQKCLRRAEGYRRRGIAPRPCARERQNSGPYWLQCRKGWPRRQWYERTRTRKGVEKREVRKVPPSRTARQERDKG